MFNFCRCPPLDQPEFNWFEHDNEISISNYLETSSSPSNFGSNVMPANNEGLVTMAPLAGDNFLGQRELTLNSTATSSLSSGSSSSLSTSINTSPVVLSVAISPQLSNNNVMAGNVQMVSVKNTPTPCTIDPANLYTTNADQLGYDDMGFDIGDNIFAQQMPATMQMSDVKMEAISSDNYIVNNAMLGAVSQQTQQMQQVNLIGTMNINDLFDSAGSANSSALSDLSSPNGGSVGDEFELVDMNLANGFIDTLASSNRGVVGTWKAFSPLTPSASSSTSSKSEHPTNVVVSVANGNTTNGGKVSKRKPNASNSTGTSLLSSSTSNSKRQLQQHQQQSILAKGHDKTCKRAKVGKSIVLKGTPAKTKLTSGAQVMPTVYTIKQEDSTNMDSITTPQPNQQQQPKVSKVKQANANVAQRVLSTGCKAPAGTEVTNSVKVISDKKDLIKYLNTNANKMSEKSVRLVSTTTNKSALLGQGVKNKVINGATTIVYGQAGPSTNKAQSSMTCNGGMPPIKPKQTLTRSSRIIDAEVNDEERRLLIKEGKFGNKETGSKAACMSGPNRVTFPLPFRPPSILHTCAGNWTCLHKSS